MGNILSSELFEEDSNEGGGGKVDSYNQPIKQERKKRRAKTLRRKNIEYNPPNYYQDDYDSYIADDEKGPDTHIHNQPHPPASLRKFSEPNEPVVNPQASAQPHSQPSNSYKKRRKPTTYKNRSIE